MEKYLNKYRIPSARLQNWNYGAMGAYFVTVCTKHREHFFGEVCNGGMILNELGRVVESEWLETVEIRKDMQVELGEFVVMPNHFHGIVIIGENEFNTGDIRTGRYAMHCVSTPADEGTPFVSPTGNQFGPQSKNLAAIMRGFKSAVTMFARQSWNVDFAWQTRYHDHIIRNAESFDIIQRYIANNPQSWEEDLFYMKQR